MIVEARAPAVLKFAGEHRILYGGQCLAAAVGMYSGAKVAHNPRPTLEVKFIDEDKLQAFTRAELQALYRSYKGRENLQAYVAENHAVNGVMLQCATIAARCQEELGSNLMNSYVEMRSDIPVKRGAASSAACATAFTLGILKRSGRNLKQVGDRVIIDIARDAERIAHMSENAGRIDVPAAYHGGFVLAGHDHNLKRLSFKRVNRLVVMDTGPKPNTGEMVSTVRNFYDSNRDEAEGIFSDIDKCVGKELRLLWNGDLEQAGSLMYLNHMLLRKLGASSDGLDKAVDAAMASGAYGAKLSGGGGGGLAIALAEDPEGLAESLGPMGFKAYVVEVAHEGASSYELTSICD